MTTTPVKTTDELTHITRAALLGAMAGGAMAAANQWSARKDNVLTSQDYMRNITKTAARAGVVTGATNYVARKTSQHSPLTMLAVLGLGAAGIYMLDKARNTQAEEGADDE